MNRGSTRSRGTLPCHRTCRRAWWETMAVPPPPMWGKSQYGIAGASSACANTSSASAANSPNPWPDFSAPAPTGLRCVAAGPCVCFRLRRLGAASFLVLQGFPIRTHIKAKHAAAGMHFVTAVYTQCLHGQARHITDMWVYKVGCSRGRHLRISRNGLPSVARRLKLNAAQ